MKQKKIFVISLIVLLAAIVAMSVWYVAYNQRKAAIDSYEECAAAGYPIMDSYPEQCHVPGGKTYARIIEQQSNLSTEGKTVCLLHKDTKGAQTLECALGLKADDGTYYALGTDPYDSALSVTDRRVRVNGTLKNDEDTIYQSKGTITVSSYEFLD